MSDSISMKTLFHLQDILNSDKFSEQSLLKLLGKDLTAFIEGLLDELGVGDTPLIKGNASNGAIIEGRVYIEEGAKIDPTAYIIGPTYIGPDSKVVHGAYIRGSTYVGKGAVVGHATEVKGAIFFDGAKAGHFAYVGDSILGRNVNLGAGTKLANLKLHGNEVKIKAPDQKSSIATGLRKLGAIMGDNSQTGCNAVLSPGTVLFPNTAVFPCVHFHGTLVEGYAR